MKAANQQFEKFQPRVDDEISVHKHNSFVTCVVNRSLNDYQSEFNLSNGQKFKSRRFLPLSKGDKIVRQNDKLLVFVEQDNSWIDIGTTWKLNKNFQIGEKEFQIQFKEIETKEELEHFAALQSHHYRGGSGVGRTVPIIARCKVRDLPRLLGFIEISSSMIANTARKRFLNFPYREKDRIIWKAWDQDTSKKYSNMICRIARFVIHPEVRGVGLAKEFIQAALSYAAAQWHFGGFQPRFMEITADMLRYYKFLCSNFKYVGETEGNEHRLQSDMRYLIRKALVEEGAKGMPQGGGGIMSLQRGYATKLLQYLDSNKLNLPEVIDLLQYNSGGLDQETWEALHKLNRRPKPVFMAGVTNDAKEYVDSRSASPNLYSNTAVVSQRRKKKEWIVKDLTVNVSAQISQSSDARILQDSFGFVGSDLESTILNPTTFSFNSGEITLVRGASGAGKTIFLESLMRLFSSSNENVNTEFSSELTTFSLSGIVTTSARVSMLKELSDSCVPVDMIGGHSLSDFLSITACTGLAEPQLLARPIETLSTGQKYRLRIALSILQKPEILLIDNFCENLDRYTLVAVCKGLRSLVKQQNIALIAATAGYERVQSPLQPNKKIMLIQGNCVVSERPSSRAV